MTVSKGVTCPSCEGQQVDFVGELYSSYQFAGQRLESFLPGGNLYHCTGCFLKFRFPVQTEGSYNRLYDNSATTTWSSEIVRPDWTRIVNFIHTTFPDQGKILDFGCYSGGMLTNLGKQYEKYGVEINKSAADIAAQRNNARIWQSLAEIPKEMRFDVVVAADVVEHVSNPKVLVNNLLKLLEKDGVLIITTGDSENYLWDFFGANWWYCFYLEHISFISKSWLEKFCGETTVIVNFEKFFYTHHTHKKLMLEWGLAILYGFAPNFYIWMVRRWKKMSRRPGEVGPRGVGISADHIFVVLSNNGAYL